MNRDKHMRQCIIQHTPNSENYERITIELVQEHNNKLMKEFLEFIRYPPYDIDQEDYKNQQKVDN